LLNLCDELTINEMKRTGLALLFITGVSYCSAQLIPLNEFSQLLTDKAMLSSVLLEQNLIEEGEDEKILLESFQVSDNLVVSKGTWLATNKLVIVMQDTEKFEPGIVYKRAEELAKAGWIYMGHTRGKSAQGEIVGYTTSYGKGLFTLVLTESFSRKYTESILLDKYSIKLVRLTLGR